MRWNHGVVLALLLAVVSLPGCKVEFGTGDPAQLESRVLGGEGKLVRFDLVPGEEQDVLISSKDVHLQKGFGHLQVHFESLVFELKPGIEELSLEEFVVAVYRQNEQGTLERVAASREQDVDDVELTSSRRRHVVRQKEIAVGQALEACQSSCVVKVELDYWKTAATGSALAGLVRTSVRTGASAASAPVVVGLSAGTAALFQSAPETAAAEPPTQRPREERWETEDRLLGGCAWLTEAEASAALGRTMRYRDMVGGSNHCTLEPAGGGEIVFFGVAHDVPIFDEAMKMADEVEMFVLGDRAAWLPRVATLWIEKGQTTFDVRIGEPGQPPADIDAARRKAEAVARMLIGKERGFRSSVMYTAPLQ
ncbi:MAG TPA: hypothetical protein VNA04_01710 [Thermoanaerobaculia bacterium]|nr:hypothetical protein [Thermoanaerobaculia bacterium]